MESYDFYLDEIKERNFALDAIELLTAPFELAKIFCLFYQAGLLGPISQRKIRAASAVTNSFVKLPLVAGSLQLTTKNQKVVFISRGMISFRPQTKIYYFYDDFWQSQEFQQWEVNASSINRLWLKLYKAWVIKSLQKNRQRVFCSSKVLANKYQLDPQQVIYPFFKSEDYPRVDLAVDKRAITVMLSGSDERQRSFLWKWISENKSFFSFFIFGHETEGSLFSSLGEGVRFESQYCTATMHAAFLQSQLTLVFKHTSSFDAAMGSLASGTLVAYLPNEQLSEILPIGMRIECSSIEEFTQILTQMHYQTPLKNSTMDLAEARRFALRFAERVFKEKMLLLIK